MAEAASIGVAAPAGTAVGAAVAARKGAGGDRMSAWSSFANLPFFTGPAGGAAMGERRDGVQAGGTRRCRV
ncbi:MAG TPA: hypothetical protein VK028_06005 [Micromonosporaceae bacterium]|nr:hypothetical protein [Micromonosporaceae bacterium]